MSWRAPDDKPTHWHVVVIEGLARRIVKVRGRSEAEFEAQIEGADPLRKVAIEGCREACIR